LTVAIDVHSMGKKIMEVNKNLFDFDFQFTLTFIVHLYIIANAYPTFTFMHLAEAII